MAEKNSHYKLDFKIKRDKSLGGNLTFRDFRRSYYWNNSQEYDIPFINTMVWELGEKKELSKLIPDNFDIAKACADANIILNDWEQREFSNYVKHGKNEWYKDINALYASSKGKISHGTHDRFQFMLYYLAGQTPEYKSCEAEFDNWLNKRKGLREVWDEVYDTEPTLTRFARAVNEGAFRSKVENARPRKLKIGTLVKLKDKFLNNSSKDPFYWNEEHRQSPRLGMISKFIESNAFGYGSRLLKIMWISNSQETEVMERELEILSE